MLVAANKKFVESPSCALNIQLINMYIEYCGGRYHVCVQ